METVKGFVSKTRSQIVSLDYKNDRKVQIVIGVFAIATIVIIKKLLTKRNYFDELPTYKRATSKEIGDRNKLSKIKRCSKPTDELEIIYSQKGPSSAKTMTIQEMWDIAVQNGGDLPCIGVEEYIEFQDKWVYKFTSWKETDIIINNIARSLIGIGVKKFDICNIIGQCTPLFQYIFFGVIMAGAIPGGCYTTNLSGAGKYICNLCKTKVVFAEDSVQLNKYIQVIDELLYVKYIVVYDDGNKDDEKEYETVNKNKNNIKIINFKQFMDFGDSKYDELNKELKIRKSAANPKQCAVVLYTSGTTGGSKGCMLSHDNIFYMTHASNQTYMKSGGIIPDPARALSYLPLSHIAGQTLSWWSPIYCRSVLNQQCVTYYCRKNWKKTMKASLFGCNPTTFVAVPRIYEKFYEAITAGLANASFIKKTIFNFILSVGKDYYRNTLAGGNGKIPYLWPFVRDRLCNGMIKRGIGFANCDIFVSGGAPLPNTIRETFAALNMKIVDAYGLSETTGVVVSARPNNFVPDACGPVIMGSELLIHHKDGRDPTGHGEICVRGRGVMMGYIDEFEKTKKTFDNEGYLHTGDVGYVDKFDCLHITGRIKELIVTGGGENVAPVPVEEYIKKLIPSLSQAIMIGDKKKYCSLIVSIACQVDDDGNPTNKLQAHAKLVNDKINTLEEAINDSIWHEMIRKALIKYNNDKTICVSNSCRIQYFQILHKDLSVNDGTLAASLKVKRHKLYDVYTKEIDSLYGNNPSIAVNPRRK